MARQIRVALLLLARALRAEELQPASPSQRFPKQALHGPALSRMRGGDCVRQARLLLRGGEGEESDGDAFSLGGDSSGHPHKARAALSGIRTRRARRTVGMSRRHQRRTILLQEHADAFSIGGASSPRPGEPGGAVGDEVAHSNSKVPPEKVAHDPVSIWEKQQSPTTRSIL
ncbi:hypothetical protein T484DRAFT_1791060 [Baffinella frigidus]|nr:hypothetical protein T484DRAFT_1791060 [Cryptophyta sp. CCMP2293]